MHDVPTAPIYTKETTTVVSYTVFMVYHSSCLWFIIRPVCGFIIHPVCWSCVVDDSQLRKSNSSESET